MTHQTKLTAAELDAQITQPGAARTRQAAALRSTLADLRAGSTALAEFRLLAPRPDARPRRSPRLSRWAMVTATAASAVALAIPLALRTSHSSAPAPTAETRQMQQPAADSSVEDDALLADIQTDLSTSVPASLEPLATSTTSTQ